MNAAVLCRMRRTYARNCVLVAAVYREVKADNGIGGGSATTKKVEEALPANVSPMRQPREGVEGGKPVVTADYNVYLSHADRHPDEYVEQKNDVIVIDRCSYRVVDTDKGRSNAVCLTAMCKRTG